MMSQRFTLFYAGFTVYAPALYFSQLQFFEMYRDEEDEVLRNIISEHSVALEDIKDEHLSHLKTAMSIAHSFEIKVLSEPQNYESYFSWLSYYIEAIEKEFPMTRIDHYYFLYARKISELYFNLQLLRIFIKLTVSYSSGFDLMRRIDKSAKDIEFILFKLIAATALLSSEPRQNYFNEYYKTLCHEFTPIKVVLKGDLTEEKELLKLDTYLESYEIVVKNGYKKCIVLLKELGI